MRFQTAVFDIDGTLVDNSEGILKSIQYAAEKMGLPQLPEERLRVFIGPPLFSCSREIYGISAADADRFIALYRERYSVKGYKEAVLYDGVAALLHALADKGMRLAVATGKPQQFVESILEEMGVKALFSSIHGILFESHDADKSGFIRQCLRECGTAPADAVMVGDRRFDMEAAKNTAVFAAGVSYGFGSREELQTAGADVIFDSAGELCDYLLQEV